MSKLQEMNIEQLKAKCRELGIEKYGSLKKDELIEVITKKLSEGADKSTQENDSKATQDETKDNESDIEDKFAKDQAEVSFVKNIKGAFGFNGVEYKGNFKLSTEDANHKKIKNAVETGILTIKK